jgi:probable phosphoglycerate mutase
LRVIVEADGGSRGNPGPAGYGAVVLDPETGAVLVERAEAIGTATNNVAEYGGLIAGLAAASSLGATEVEVRMDSKLVVEQMSGRWQIKHEQMRRLAAEARAAFPPAQVRYTWVPRAENGAADALANEAMDHRTAVVRDAVAAPTARAAAAPLPAAPAPGPGRRPPGPVASAPGAAMHTGADEPATFVLVRHGQTDATAARAYAGGDVPGAPLNARGRTEAARAADLVARIGREVWPDLARPTGVVSSSTLRTQQTAAAIARRLGVRVDLDDAFAECRFGAWEGLTPAQVEERWPGTLQRWLRDPSRKAPGGESMHDVAARVQAGLARLRRDLAGRTVVVVTHTIAIRAGVGATIGVAPDAWYGLRVPPASLTVVRLWREAHELTVLGCPSEL